MSTRPLAAALLTTALMLTGALPGWTNNSPNNTPNFTLEDGYDAFEQGNVAKAIGIWAQLADQGNATAQLNLGQIYRLGNGVEQNDAEAVKWYIMAAQNGSQTAAANLMMMEQDGRATREEVAQAFIKQPQTANMPVASVAKTPADIAPAPVKAPSAPVKPAAPAVVAVAKPQPQVVPEAATIARPAPTSQAKPVPKPRPEPRAEPRPNAQPTLAAKPAKQKQWIATLPRRNLVIQLLKSADPESLTRYADAKLGSAKTQAHIVPTVRGVKKEYLLLLGPYNTLSQADRALKKLPADVQQGMPWAGGQPWVRTAESVQRISK